jgi:hypothetical protein
LLGNNALIGVPTVDTKDEVERIEANEANVKEAPKVLGVYVPASMLAM